MNKKASTGIIIAIIVGAIIIAGAIMYAINLDSSNSDQKSSGSQDSSSSSSSSYSEQIQQETEVKKCEVKYGNSDLQGITTYCEDGEGGSNNIADPVYSCKVSDKPYSYTYLYKTSYYCDSNDLCQKKISGVIRKC